MYSLQLGVTITNTIMSRFSAGEMDFFYLKQKQKKKTKKKKKQ